MSTKITERQITVGTLLKIMVVLAIGYYIYDLRQQVQLTQMQAGWVKQINDSTMAQIAALQVERDALLGLQNAARSMRGQLVAGVQIRTKADTVVRVLGDAETVMEGETRRASVEDSTALGVKIRVDAEAPPYPAPLRIGYNVTVPEFNPEVGFVKVGDQYAAVVTWRGQTYTVENSFYRPEAVRQPKWVLYTSSTVGGDEGILRKPDWSLGVERHLGSKYSVEVTGTTSWYNDPQLAISVRRKLWSSK